MKNRSSFVDSRLPEVVAILKNSHKSIVDRQLVKQPLYDYFEIAGGGSYDFFAFPIGSKLVNAGIEQTKTEADTNLWSSGMLTRGNDFFLTGIRVCFFPGELSTDPVLDTRKLYGNGALRFDIMNRSWLTLGPLAMFPPMTRVEYPHTLQRFGYFAMEPVLWIEECQHFRVRLSLDSRIRLSAPARLGVHFDGFMLRWY